ncbi:glycoside hydrolase subgroup catalytic core [Colletotrichum tofieldiae]|uniref:Glycoside hydrolase subgroup catalytic core n=1 Tax=Colletotrichum tofieldiae TaxID=708197 RepID=A0A166R2Z4_9PEZI|nr:glycoside hydrolase subgroup catalytic core [Colletotrichum tofieldiae]GKT83911.1 glycoside hydrolase subgroup catalytic core [Colletotrichum tofieldiae]
MMFRKLIGAIALVASLPVVQGQAVRFNNLEGVDIWCGKAYRPTNSSFDPGGWFPEPVISDVPLLRLKVRPRLSIYLETDPTTNLLIDAVISNQVGSPLPIGFGQNSSISTPKPLNIEIFVEGNVLATQNIALGSRDNEVSLAVGSLAPRMEPYNITIRTMLDSTHVYEDWTEFSYLPYPDDYGSVARIDNLHGGLLAQRGKDAPWDLIFAYTYYTQWTLYWNDSVDTLNEFAAMGYNVIHIVPTGSLGEIPFPWDEFEPYLQRADELGLYLRYDVLWTWPNLTNMVDQVTRLRTHPSILLWYQSDEADGKANPANSTGIAYEQIKAIDPYHPVSLALNCWDFHYAEYAAGADIVMSDVYPVAINATFSTVYGTECNTTYGCCGCDDCEGKFEDIAVRLDEFYRRDEILGWQKTQWFAPQAFGNETFWARYPTAEEEAVMTVLSVNHGAKGIVMWNYPATDELESLTSRLAGLFTDETAVRFLLGTARTQNLVVEGANRVDAAVWVDEKNGQALISVVNLEYEEIRGEIRVVLPEGVKAGKIVEVLWGDVAWELGDGGLVATEGLFGLQTSVIVADLL